MTTEFLKDGEEGLRGGLRHLILRLNRPQLCLVNGWIQQELDRASRAPGNRIVRVPDLDDSAVFSGDIVELLGQVRRRINALPRGSLVVLNHWVVMQLEEHVADD
ncbi:MAG: hypothetical protein KTR31_36780 [Myxococcales bacterium]|nr:hypothetical protein [Myxococcales bacterium]